MSTWLLPENLADILPAEARRIEELRRDLLDLYQTYGFELVAPPLAEYLDSLLSGNGRALNLRTSKLIDQLSGRTMGIRADITPQVARIDAHLLNRQGVTRLCYCGPVLHARPSGLLAQRELLQIGAEIFGHAGVEADIQIIELALESVHRSGVSEARLDLNHPGVFRALINADPSLPAYADIISDMLAIKDAPGLAALEDTIPHIKKESIQAFIHLAGLYGDAAILERARQCLPPVEGLARALDELEVLVRALPSSNFSIDLADMGSGYGYHSGVVFSIYAHDWHDALVKGGRYDGIGEAFGRARAATGFSLDLRKLSAGLAAPSVRRAIRAPWGRSSSLTQAMQSLRKTGEVVIQLFPGQEPALDEFIIDRELVEANGQWVVQSL